MFNSRSQTLTSVLATVALLPMARPRAPNLILTGEPARVGQGSQERRLSTEVLPLPAAQVPILLVLVILHPSASASSSSPPSSSSSLSFSSSSFYTSLFNMHPIEPCCQGTPCLSSSFFCDVPSASSTQCGLCTRCALAGYVALPPNYTQCALGNPIPLGIFPLLLLSTLLFFLLYFQNICRVLLFSSFNGFIRFNGFFTSLKSY